MPPPLQEVFRESDATDSEMRRRPRGNPPRFLLTRFKHFHIMFRAFNIKQVSHMIAALFTICLFTFLSTILYFLLQRFELRAIASRKRRILAATMFTLRLLFVYVLIMLVDIMNLWLILAMGVGHMAGWLVYHVFIDDCLARRDGGRDGEEDGGGGGGGKDRRESSFSSDDSGDTPHQFWDIS